MPDSLPRLVFHLLILVSLINVFLEEPQREQPGEG